MPKVSRTIAAVFVATLAGGVACSSNPGPASGATSTRNPSLITEQEVVAASASNAYELVERLRPQWLRAGGVGAITNVGTGGMMQGGAAITRYTLVYLDNVKLGTPETLRSISASGVKSIRFLSAERAAATLPDLGRDPINGAIVVTTQ